MYRKGCRHEWDIPWQSRVPWKPGGHDLWNPALDIVRSPRQPPTWTVSGTGTESAIKMLDATGTLHPGKARGWTPRGPADPMGPDRRYGEPSKTGLHPPGGTPYPERMPCSQTPHGDGDAPAVQLPGHLVDIAAESPGPADPMGPDFAPYQVTVLGSSSNEQIVAVAFWI